MVWAYQYASPGIVARAAGPTACRGSYSEPPCVSMRARSLASGFRCIENPKMVYSLGGPMRSTFTSTATSK